MVESVRNSAWQAPHARQYRELEAREISGQKEPRKFDGIFVLRTNAGMTPLNTVLRYR